MPEISRFYGIVIRMYFADHWPPHGDDEQQGTVFSYVSAEQRIAPDHPLRRIRAMTDAALRELSAEFDELYAPGGRPSIAPERLLRALLLQVFCGIWQKLQVYYFMHAEGDDYSDPLQFSFKKCGIFVFYIPE